MPLREKPSPGLGLAIRELRLEARLTQEALAYQADVTVGQLSKIERGHSDARWGTVRRIALGLRVPLADLAARAEALERELESAGTGSR